MPISRPAVSQHLKVLKDAGIVHDAPQGAPGSTASTRSGWRGTARQLDQFWSDALGNLAAPDDEQERGAG